MVNVILKVVLSLLPFLIPAISLIGTVRVKYAELYNPIRKNDNSDDELNFGMLNMTKTRNVFN